MLRWMSPMTKREKGLKLALFLHTCANECDKNRAELPIPLGFNDISVHTPGRAHWYFKNSNEMRQIANKIARSAKSHS
jgi:hypothetical protein